MSYEDLTYTVTLSYRERIATAVALQQMLTKCKYFAEEFPTQEFWAEQVEVLEKAHALLQSAPTNL